MESGEGELIVGREANKEMTLREKIDAYLPCAYCCVMYLKHDLWRHARGAGLEHLTTQLRTV